jgi:hypothetical protein
MSRKLPREELFAELAADGLRMVSPSARALLPGDLLLLLRPART